MDTSPKFSERSKFLAEQLPAAGLKKLWQEHVRPLCRQQSVLDLADYQDIHANIASYIDRVSRAIRTGRYKPRRHIQVLAEKSKGLCRRLVVPDAIDALVLQALVKIIYPSVIKNQPSRRAFFEPEAHSFSMNGSSIDRSYGSFNTWLQFQKAIFGFVSSKQFIAVTDIANYYDHIHLDALRALYVSFDGMSEHTLDLLFHIIEHLQWHPDFAPASGQGLPQMNLDGPRLLAHSFLFELDSFLERTVPGHFVRFMDDIDVGVESIAEAKRVLRDMDLVLQTRGVRLNSGKTHILKSSEAMKYYFIRDNLELDRIDKLIKSKISSAVAKHRTPNISRQTVSLQRRFVRSWTTQGYFDKGQGDKVLKRYITLSIRYNFKLPDSFLREAVFKRPALRESALRAIAWYGYTKTRLDIVLKYVRSEWCVDEESIFYCARALLDMGCPSKKSTRREVIQTALHLSKIGRIGFVSALWILSKYGSADAIWDVISSNEEVWIDDPWLGRQVAALYPRLQAKRIFFLSLIRESKNTGAHEVIKYYLAVERDAKTAGVLLQYLTTKNPSLPHGISHQKVLIALVFLRSAADFGKKAAVKKFYKRLQLDAAHRSLLNRFLR